MIPLNCTSALEEWSGKSQRFCGFSVTPWRVGHRSAWPESKPRSLDACLLNPISLLNICEHFLSLVKSEMGGKCWNPYQQGKWEPETASEKSWIYWVFWSGEGVIYMSNHIWLQTTHLPPAFGLTQQTRLRDQLQRRLVLQPLLSAGRPWLRQGPPGTKAVASASFSLLSWASSKTLIFHCYKLRLINIYRAKHWMQLAAFLSVSFLMICTVPCGIFTQASHWEMNSYRKVGLNFVKQLLGSFIDFTFG